MFFYLYIEFRECYFSLWMFFFGCFLGIHPCLTPLRSVFAPICASVRKFAIYSPSPRKYSILAIRCNICTRSASSQITDKGIKETQGRSYRLLLTVFLGQGHRNCFAPLFFASYMILESALCAGMHVHGCTCKVDLSMDATGDRFRDSRTDCRHFLSIIGAKKHASKTDLRPA